MDTVHQLEYGRIAIGIRAYRNWSTAERQLRYGDQMAPRHTLSAIYRRGRRNTKLSRDRQKLGILLCIVGGLC